MPGKYEAPKRPEAAVPEKETPREALERKTAEALKEALPSSEAEMAEKELEQDLNVEKRLSLAVNAKDYAARARLKFIGLKPPFAGAYAIIDRLNYYAAELEDALEDAQERPEIQQNLPRAQEERRALVEAIDDIGAALGAIKKLVEVYVPPGKEKRTQAEQDQELAERIEAAEAELGTKWGEDATKELKKPADQRMAERIEAVEAERGTAWDQEAAFNRAMEEGFAKLEKGDRKRYEEKLMSIPVDIEATRAKHEEISNYVAGVRAELSRGPTYEDRNTFDTYLIDLSKMYAELEERKHLLDTAEPLDEVKAELEIIAQAMHEIEDARHEIHDYEFETRGQAEESLFKKEELDAIIRDLGERIEKHLKEHGSKDDADTYMFKNRSALKRGLAGLFGKKTELLSQKELQNILDKIETFHNQYLLKRFSEEERKSEDLKKAFEYERERSPLARLSDETDVHAVWKVLHSERDRASENIPPVLAAASAFGEGEAKMRARMTDKKMGVERALQRVDAEEYREIEIARAEDAGVKNATEIVREIMEDPHGGELTFFATDLVTQMAALKNAMEKGGAKKIREEVKTLDAMNEELIEQGILIDDVSDMLDKAERNLSAGKKKSKKRARKTAKKSAEKKAA